MGGLNNKALIAPNAPDASVPSTLKSFSFNDLKTATKNFRPESLLGEGGFGWVFKGWIDANTLAPTRPGTGLVVAIKRLKRESFQGHKEWLVCRIWQHLCYFFFFGVIPGLWLITLVFHLAGRS